MVAKHKGFPASLYDIMQELGRVDQKLSGEPGSNSYQIHVSFNSYVSLYILITGTKDKKERPKLLQALDEVIGFLVQPKQCYHSFIENYFEVEPEQKTGCGNLCTYCCSGHKKFTKRLSKIGLCNYLTTTLLCSVPQNIPHL